ncbi:hypothetical protein P879_00193, partial [Paragonimus westermani]
GAVCRFLRLLWCDSADGLFAFVSAALWRVDRCCWQLTLALPYWISFNGLIRRLYALIDLV